MLRTLRFLTPAGVLAVVAAAALPADTKAPPQPSISSKEYAKMPDGTPIARYELTNSKGMKAAIITYGAILSELLVPDGAGKPADVVLGFDDLKGYLGNPSYFGSNVGRVANRVAKGKFTLDGKQYTLAINNGPNALHGGKQGFDKKVWKVVPAEAVGGQAVKLQYVSPDGEEGYPGQLTATVQYTLTDNNELKIDYTATTDKATPVNLAHHSYFNLGGHNAGDILGHEVMINADQITPTDDTLIPTGELKSVRGTPFDFTTATAIGKRIGELKGEPGGYDVNYVLRGGSNKEPVLAARVTDPKSGRVMEVLTTEPGLQFYTGNFLNGTEKGKGGAVYKKHSGFCMEAQHFPDSVNQPKFPSVILKPGETYKQTTVYKFGAK
jgi:aldose 1-epimerase